ncbi:MAG: hypothetical protein J7L32_04735 [Thermoplasmata archaeon]|nr:hypothetical protein [Thermoplasmata archaeon]
MKDFCVLINPNSQNGSTIKKAKIYLKKLTKEGFVFDTYYTYSKDNFLELFKRIIDDYDMFVVIGGDGLIHGVVQSIVDRKEKRIAIVPSGSGNMLASHHNLFSIDDTISSIKRNSLEKVDLVKVSYLTKDGEKKTVYSHCIIGVGYIADALKHATYVFRKLGPKWCYPLGGVFATFKIDPFDVELGVDNRLKSIPDATTLIMLNQGKIGPFTVAENVKDTDGYVDYVMFHTGTSSVEATLCLLDTFFGRYHFNKHRYVGRAKKIEIKLSTWKDLMIDGEMYEKTLRFSVEVIPKALTVFSNNMVEKQGV